LKERLEGQEGEEGDVSSCWMTLRKQEDNWKLKEEAQDRSLWKTQFGRGYGPVARQTATCLEEDKICSTNVTNGSYTIDNTE
jgi:hypothetical protein